VTYNIAVWEADRPATNAAADQAFWELLDQMHSRSEPPTEKIRAYVESLLDLWPDITDERGDDSPWADGPLMNNANGNAIYFSLVFSMAEEASGVVGQLAQQHGLVCYDPQEGALRPMDGEDSSHADGERAHRPWRSWLASFLRRGR